MLTCIIYVYSIYIIIKHLTLFNSFNFYLNSCLHTFLPCKQLSILLAHVCTIAFLCCTPCNIDGIKDCVFFAKINILLSV